MNSGALVNRIFVILTIPLLIYLGFSTARKAMEVYQLNQQASGIRQDIVQLKDRNAELRRQTEYLQSPEYVERVAREQLGLVRPDDIALVLVSPSQREEQPQPAPAPVAAPTRTLSNWERWWDFFFGDGL